MRHNLLILGDTFLKTDNSSRRVLYFTQEEISSKPPCVSEVLILKDLGFDVRVLTTYCNEKTQEVLKKKEIPLTLMRSDRNQTEREAGKNNKTFTRVFQKAGNSVRYNILLRQFFHKYADTSTVVWLGTEKSLMCYPSFWKKHHPLIQNALEFYEDKRYQRTMRNTIGIADVTTACEHHRAALMQKYWGLKEKPFVLPNKPYLHPRKRNLSGSTRANQERIEKLKGRKVLLYQGILTADRDLSILAEALAVYRKRSGNALLFVIIGSGDESIAARAKKIYSDTLYLGFIPAPLHLEITSHARFCVAYYRDNSLNNRYCAPNKIYEAAGFGIPILANNIPGLTDTVGKSKAGICVNFRDKEAVADALLLMDRKYDQFSKAAASFYEATDNTRTIQQIIDKAFEESRKT